MLKRLCAWFIVMMNLICLSMVTYADDGTLKIDTNIQRSGDKKEIFYIEQTEALAQLFKVKTTRAIRTYHQEALAIFKQDKESLFLTFLPRENITQTYQALLFTPKQQSGLKAEISSVLLSASETVFPWQVGLFLIVGIGLTSGSVYRMVRKRSNNG